MEFFLRDTYLKYNATRSWLSKPSGAAANLKRSAPILLACMIILSITLAPSAHAVTVVTVSPAVQSVPQGSLATYSVTLNADKPNDIYAITVLGLPPGSVYSAPSIPTDGVGNGGPSNIVLDAGSLPGLYCPGTYSFQVRADSTVVVPDSGTSAVTSLTVFPVGPPLHVTLTSDKPTYRIGDKVTISISVNRPAEGLLQITPPSGSPSTFSYVMYGPTYALTRTFTADKIGRYGIMFQADDFCSGFDSAQIFFDVTPDTYDVTISLSGVPSDVSANINVDGTPQGSMTGSEIKKLSFKVETQHSISVDQYVPGQAGVRYFCSLNTWNVGSAGSKTFEYETQYQLTVATDPDGVTQVTGSGWYKSGSPVQIGQVPDTLSGPAGTRYVFKGWKIDGAQQSGNQISVTMDAPHNVVAVYETQYQLIVDSAYGNPQGSGFYAAGSTATFSVTTPVGLIIQQVFVNWDGDFTGTSPTGSIEMTKPARVHANWGTSYFQLYILLAVLAVAIVAIFLLWRRRQGAAPPTTKPTPEMPAETETGEAPSELSSDAAKCSSCRADVPPGQTFCQNCGAKMT